MRLAIAGVISAGLMAGCTTTVDKKLQEIAPQVCASVDTSHLLFVALVRSGEIEAKWIDDEAKLYTRVQVLCARPDQVNVLSVIIVAADAYAEVIKKAKQ